MSEAECTLYFEEITSDDEENKEVDTSIVGDKAKGSVTGDTSCQSVLWVTKELSDAGSNVPPTGRGGASLNYIGQGKEGKLILFGGADRKQSHFADVHQYDLETKTWKLIETTGTPPCSRSGHSVVTLADEGTGVDRYLIAFGGINFVDENVFNDVYCLDTTCGIWTRLHPEGTPPPARNSHTATMISSNRMLVFGGSSPDEGPMNDLWILTFSSEDGGPAASFKTSWSKVQAASSTNVGPTAREMHTASWIDDDSMIVSGGRQEDGSFCADLWILDTKQWRWNLIGALPSPRCAHGALTFKDPDFGVGLCVYAGFNGVDRIFEDLKYSKLIKIEDTVKLEEWKDGDLNIQPCQRFGHACCPGGGNGEKPDFFVFGGVNISKDLSDLWQFQAK